MSSREAREAKRRRDFHEEIVLLEAAPALASDKRKKRPMLLLIPRPAPPYDANRAPAWELSRWLIGRILAKRHSVVTVPT